MSLPELTEDLIYGGRVKIAQPARGYRVNVDTVLLAAAVEAEPGAKLMEAGCGVGGALLCVAQRAREATFVGVEREPAMAELARRNIEKNSLVARVSLIEGEALDGALDIGTFDGVFVNPPFDREGDGRPPLEARRHAHIADAPIETWIAALANRLRGAGALTMIHRAAKLAEILAALDGRLGGVEITPIRPRATEAAKRILVRARKGSRAPLRLLKGLDLHDDSGAKHTPETEAILRGDAEIAWS